MRSSRWGSIRRTAGATPGLRKLGGQDPARGKALRSRSGLPLHHALRSGRFESVFGEHSVAEVDRRHVAQALRRKPARGLGLALGEAGCERMSEAGSRWPNREISGGPQAAARAQARAEDEGTYRWKAPRVVDACAVLTGGARDGPGLSRPSSGCRGRLGGRQEVSAGSAPGSCWVDNARTSCARDTG